MVRRLVTEYGALIDAMTLVRICLEDLLALVISFDQDSSIFEFQKKNPLISLTIFHFKDQANSTALGRREWTAGGRSNAALPEGRHQRSGQCKSLFLTIF